MRMEGMISAFAELIVFGATPPPYPLAGSRPVKVNWFGRTLSLPSPGLPRTTGGGKRRQSPIRSLLPEFNPRTKVVRESPARTMRGGQYRRREKRFSVPRLRGRRSGRGRGGRGIWWWGLVRRASGRVFRFVRG